MNNIEVRSPVTKDSITGLRRYLNINWSPTSGAGKWLFGFQNDRFLGLESVWTDDESRALADNGEVAAMLGLGSNGIVSVTANNSARATKWDSILTQVPGGTHATECMLRRSNKRKGGKFDVIRRDGQRLEMTSLF